MLIFDISLPISETLVVWPGDPAVRLRTPMAISKGDVATVSEISMGVHSGTHVDAPAHFLVDGKSMEDIDLEVLIGKARVFDTGKADLVTPEVLERLEIPAGTERILLRTRNSRYWAAGDHAFAENFTAVSEDGARWLVARGIRLVGIDYLSIAPFAAPVQTHRVLLEAGVVIVEGLCLAAVREGEYQLVCLPLRIAGVEGAPARAVLIQAEPGRE